MTNDPRSVDAHYGRGGLLERIDAALASAGVVMTELTVDDLAAVDAFHTRGRGATLELVALAGVCETDRVLDVGCGLGGTARHLAHEHGCTVVGVDLTNEFVEVGSALTERVGLSSRVEHRQGSALELPFDDASFDVVWTEHVQMNIADKHGFYDEIARVCRSGGRLVFHDVFRGDAEAEPDYPVPWAEVASLSALATVGEVRAAMTGAGLTVAQWNGKNAESLAFFDEVMARIAAGGPPPLGIHLLMGETAGDKLTNYLRNLHEGRITVAMGVATKPDARPS